MKNSTKIIAGAAVACVVSTTLAWTPVPQPLPHPLPLSLFVSAFASRYPGSQSDNNVLVGTGQACQLCHQDGTGGNGWNAYGWTVKGFVDQGQSIINAMALAEGSNSDMDPGGATNLDEINADTQPGWTDGANNTIFFKDGSTLANQLPPAGILGSLDPFACQPDLGFQGPGLAAATLCGTGLNVGESSAYEVTGAQPSAAGAFLVSVPNQANVVLFAATPNPGTLVSGAGLAGSFPIFADANGNLSFTVPGLGTVADLVFQCVFVDTTVPNHKVAFTNGVLAQFGQ